jgi:hypothetical protein
MTCTRQVAFTVLVLCCLSARTLSAEVPAPGGGKEDPSVVQPGSDPPVTATQPAAPPPRVVSVPDETRTGCSCSPQCWWASADYTFGWIRGVKVPPLLTTISGPGAPPTVLFGNDNLNTGVRSGFQLRGGFWLDQCATCGIEAGVLFLDGVTDRGLAGDRPGAIIGRPFFNTLTNAPDFQIVSVPGSVSGRAAIDAASHELCGADVAISKAICCDCRGRLDFLVGYRYLSFDDSIRAFEDLHPTTAPFTPGSHIGVSDGFTASNQFNGLLLGLAGEYRFDCWYIQGRGTISFGETSRRATIAGMTAIAIPPLQAVVSPGGLLALSSNSGTASESDWVVVPELSARVGYQITQNLRMYAGYTFLLWPGMFRAANQIDPVVNPALIPPVQGAVAPGQFRPLFPDRQSSLWVQAISIGMALQF